MLTMSGRQIQRNADFGGRETLSSRIKVLLSADANRGELFDWSIAPVRGMLRRNEGPRFK